MESTATQLGLFQEESTLQIDGKAKLPEYLIRKSARARRLSIQVFPRGRVEVVVPRRTSAAEVERFVEKSRDWITDSLRSFSADPQAREFALPSRIFLAAIGRRFAVDYRPDASYGTVRYREREHLLRLSGKVHDREACLKALRRWLSRVARREFSPMLLQLSVQHSLPFKRTHIRMQKTRWGSRSSSGTISLNLCLLFADPKAVRYLMLHELCHGRHMNHSRRFWKLLESLESKYRELDQELKDSWRAVPAWLDEVRAS